ncbi:hypothetical protein GGH94_006049 [Coemansia aciculifera]|uniref:Ribonucleases P/MRP subunit Pop8-like domain-containing protein n=1 Tax=Coemansia aciculifera TaxID=417176 RepID=A0A9W8IL83_9FUNG|nr:hypothetical protein GGH94_006049 [Coemansia aciculifera]
MEVDQPLAVPSALPTFKATISKQPFYYFSIELLSTSTLEINPVQYFGYIQFVLRQWLGDVGAGMSVDMLDMKACEATIRVPFDKYKQVWQAMTLIPFKLPDGTSARLQVLRGSAFAMGLAAGSRQAFL